MSRAPGITDLGSVFRLSQPSLLYEAPNQSGRGMTRSTLTFLSIGHRKSLCSPIRLQIASWTSRRGRLLNVPRELVIAVLHY